jgi:gamma-glutamyltranspeptidase/glutathione hydrolase
MDNFSRTQSTRKAVIATAGGVIAAQHRRAAEVGAAVLKAGGDAVDAAVATSFAIGVVEPWMSGVAGGGAMTLWRAGEGQAHVVNYGMRAPAELDPADYPLARRGAQGSDLFTWAPVEGDRNVQGATAIAVPGVVAGMALAHERFGRLPWRDLLQPAVGLAREGLKADWFSGLMIASCARFLAADPDAARMFLDDGQWPIVGGWAQTLDRHLDQQTLAATLERLADHGAADFYTGDIARMLVRDVRAKGGCLSEADLHDYRAVIEPALAIAYRGGQVWAAPGFTAGPTLQQCLQTLSGSLTPAAGGPGPDSYVAYAKAVDDAYRSRLAGVGDNDSPEAPSCTTHFCVVDRDGNMCAVTQTLLSVFGSRVVSPSTGVLMNNGIMWFDPTPGRPNSLAPGKRCLMNVCPVVGQTAAGTQFALGASGGRKILGAVLQLTSFLMDHGLTLEQAFHQQRIDMSGGAEVTADGSLPAAVIDALRRVFPTVTAPRTLFPYSFACPSGVLREGGLNMGCTEIMSPWGDTVAQGQAAQ